MNFCPNLHDKKIKLEFDELISIFGENGAYLIWDRTNGNGLELAPNGANSKLFLDLLKLYDGDRKLALIAKAKVYTDEFFNWFGDWINNPSKNNRKEKSIQEGNTFDHSLFRGQAAVPEIDSEGNLHLRTAYDSLSKLKTLSFASDKNEALHYGYRAAKHPYIIELNEDYINTVLPKEEYEREKVVNKKLFRYDEESNEVRLSFNDELVIPKGQYSISHDTPKIIINNVNDAIYEVYSSISRAFSADAQEYNGVSELEGAISKQDIQEPIDQIINVIGAKFYDIILISEASKDHAGLGAYGAAPRKTIQQYIDEGYLIEKDYDLWTKEDLEVNPPEVIKAVSKEWAYYELTDKAKKEINEKINNSKNKNSNVSKVVDENGEPLIVYHGSKKIFDVFDSSKSESRQYLSEQIKATNFFSSDKTVADFFALTENQSLAIQISKSISVVLDAFTGEDVDENILDDEIWTDAARRTGKSKEFVKDFWENKVPGEYKINDEFGNTRMKDQDIDKYKYNVFLSMKNPIILDAKGERADKFIEANKEILNNNDEVIIKNINETVGKQDIATDYLVRQPNQIKSATDNNSDFSTTDDNIYHNLNMNSLWREYYRLLDIARRRINDPEFSLSDFNKENHVNFGFNPDTKEITTKSPKLYGIPLTSNTDNKTLTLRKISRALLLDYLKNKFNLNFKQIPSYQYDAMFGRDSNCSITGDTVYIRDRDVNTLSDEQIIEEFLHPLVHALYLNNEKLSNKLLKEARKCFPKLCKKIEYLYKDMGADVINEEIITLVLSKYLSKEISDNGTNTRTLVTYIKQLILKIIHACKDLFGNVNVDNLIISGKDIRDVFNFNNLAQLINSKEVSFNDVLGISEHRDNKSVNDILDNQLYDEIQLSLLNSGIDNNDYCIRQAIERTRSKYMDDEMNKFAEEYILKLVNRRTSKGFFSKVKRFFLSPFNKGKIKNPDGKKLEEARKLAFEEFNLTLRNLILTSISEDLNANKIPGLEKLGDLINEAHLNDEIYTIQAALNILNQARVSDKLFSINKENIRDLLLFMKKCNLQQYQQGIALFDTFDKFHRAFLLKDKSTLNPAQQNFINQFILDAEQTWFSDLHNAINSDQNLSDTITMFYQQDAEIINHDVAAFDKIKQGLESRLISILKQHRSDKNIVYNLKSRILSLKSRNPYDAEDMYKTYFDFLQQAEVESEQAILYFESFLPEYGGSKSISTMAPDKLMYSQTDVIGYYQYIINNYISDLKSESKLSDRLIQDLTDLYTNQVQLKISDAIDRYNKVLNKYADYIIDQFVDNNVTLGEINHIRYTMHQWVRNQVDNGNLMLLENFAGDATISKSPIVSMIANILISDDREVVRNTNKVGHDLMGLYSKAESFASKLGIDPFNYMKLFCELDNNDMPTGNFVRSTVLKNGTEVGINYGLYKKDKLEFTNKLCKKYNVPLDEYGRPVFNLEMKGQEAKYNSFMDELDDWKEQHSNRRYTAEYYKAKRRILGHQAMEALDDVLTQINLLLEKCTDEDGFVFVNKLSPSERSMLNGLMRDKRELGNPYKALLTQNGSIVQFEEKEGDALEIAQRIQAWNQYLGGDLKYTSDWTKYNEALAKITDPAERQLFIQWNTSLKLTDEFYNDLQGLFSSKQTDQDYLEAKLRIGKILGMTKDRQGYYSPDLLRLNDEAWAELHRLEQLKLDKMVKSHGSSNPGGNKIELVKYFVMTDDGNGNQISVYEYLRRQAMALMLINPNAMDEFYAKYHVTAQDGSSVIMSCFYVLGPKDLKYVKQLPVGNYMEVDELNSKFVNKEYNKDDQMSEQPKVSQYRNKAYDKIKSDRDAFAFYNAILQMMQESIDKLSTPADFDKYTMPLITDDTMSLMARNISKFKLSGAIQSVSQHFTITEKDEDLYEDDLALRPNNTRVETIPVRFVRKLNDPTKVSCDILHTVLQFYEMAENYRLKSQSVPIVESIISKMNGGIGENTQSAQVERANTFLEMYGYGRKQHGIGYSSNKKMSKGQKLSTKFINNLRTISNTALLAGRLASATKGALSAKVQTDFIIPFVGQYYGFGDRIWTGYLMAKGVFRTLASIGVANTHSKIQACMQHNGAASDPSHTFKNHHKLRWRRWLDHFKMGLFTIGDYNSNAIITLSTYHATRLVENPITGELKFCNKEEAIDMYEKCGKTAKEGKKAYRKSSVNHLYKMYELGENGNFNLKDKVEVKIGGKKITINPKDYVTKLVENRVAGTVEARASIANGVVGEHHKGQVYQGTFTKLLTVMRGYLFSQGWEAFNSADYFGQLIYDKGAIRDFGNNRPIRGLYNFETGHILTGFFIGAAKTIGVAAKNVAILARNVKAVCTRALNNKQQYELIPTSYKAGLKSILLSIVGVATFLMLALLLMQKVVGKYPDSWIAQISALILAGVAIETATPIFPMFTAMDLMTTMTVVNSFAGNVYNIVPIATQKLLGTYNGDEIIKYGPYRHKPRWFKDVMKSLLSPTGLTGYYESFAPAIPGIDKLTKNGKVVESEDVQKRREQLDAASKHASNLMENFDITSLETWEDLGGMFMNFGDALTNPYGGQSSYDYYRGHVFPATWLPKRSEVKQVNEEEPKNTTVASSKRRRNSRARSNRRR